MRFDYRMRPGVVTRSNALALMRAVGLDIVLLQHARRRRRASSHFPLDRPIWSDIDLRSETQLHNHLGRNASQ